jgi:hypothetical protein
MRASTAETGGQEAKRNGCSERSNVALPVTSGGPSSVLWLLLAQRTRGSNRQRQVMGSGANLVPDLRKSPRRAEQLHVKVLQGTLRVSPSVPYASYVTD